MNTKEELKKLRKEARILRQQNATYKRGSEIHKQNSQEKDQIIKEQKEVIEKKDNKIDQLEERVDDLERQLKLKDDQLDTYKAMIFKANVEEPEEDKKKKKRKLGGQPGHRGHGRKKPKKIDKKMEIKLERCPDCGTELEESKNHYERIVEDIVIPMQTIVTMYLIQRQWCPTCKKEVHAVPEGTLPNCRIGLNAIRLILFLKYKSRLPLKKIEETLREQHGLEIKAGAIQNILYILRERFKKKHQEILEEIRESRVKHADETGFRIKGQNGWCWAFATKEACYYTIEGTRGKGVPQEILGRNPKGVLVRDDYGAYKNINMEQMSCWAHLMRKSYEQIEKKDASEEMQRFHNELKKMFQNLKKEIEEPFDKGKRKKRYEYYLKRINQIAHRKYKQKDSQKIQIRIKNQNKNLITALIYPDVPLTNNHAELMMRPVAVMRKISGGSRSEEGAMTQAVNMSVVQTINLQGKNFFQESENILKSEV